MKCKYCNNEYKNVKQHEKYCKLNPNHRLMWNTGLTKETDKRVAENSKNSGIAIQISYQRKNPLLEYKVNCYNCGKEFKIKERQVKFNINKKYFCCKDCSHSYVGKLTTGNTKEAKCIECGKTITIPSRASSKICKCKECKLKIKATNKFISKTNKFISNITYRRNIIDKKNTNNQDIIEKIFNSNKLDINKFKLIQNIDSKSIYLNILKENLIKLGYIEVKVKETNKHKAFIKLLSPVTLDKLRKAGCKSIQRQGDLRRSKNEIEFCKLCEEYFDNVKHNECIFNGWDADVIIEDIKYAILWNGPWHYKQITKSHSIVQTQNRDKIKIEEIQKYGWTPYIIKDMGKYNKKFVKEKFNEFLNFLKENSIIK